MKKILWVALMLIPINFNGTDFNRTNIAGLRFHNHDIQLPTNSGQAMSPGDFVPYPTFFSKSIFYSSSTELQMIVAFSLYLNNGQFTVNILPLG